MTTTLTNASLADAVSLFLSTGKYPTVDINAVESAAPPPPRPQVITHSARPAVNQFILANDAAVDAQVDHAFARMESGLR
jgi:hypothetical protein